jgi:hypothetical protein
MFDNLSLDAFLADVASVTREGDAITRERR